MGGWGGLNKVVFVKGTVQSMARKSYLMPVGFLFSFLHPFWKSFSIRISIRTKGYALVFLCPCGLAFILLPLPMMSAFTILLVML